MSDLPKIDPDKAGVFRRGLRAVEVAEGTRAPKTVPNYAFGTAQFKAKVPVDVWDNELDDTRRGHVVEIGAMFPAFVVELEATEWEPATRIVMNQGPFTDSGRYRIVAVHQCFSCAVRGQHADCDICGGTNIIRGE